MKCKIKRSPINEIYGIEMDVMEGGGVPLR